jgi:adenosylcobinamide kinase/adenosylcobinamide-phosphate guanylyltransferase
VARLATGAAAARRQLVALTFLIGGARSGKSSLAVRWATDRGGPVAFVATCPRIEGDDDLDRRIAQHRADRPDWPTIEELHDLEGTVAGIAENTFVIVDCVTLWVFNLMHRGDDADAIVAAASSFGRAAAALPNPIVTISNEVGMGVHPETEEGRVYRDIVGSVNRAIAAHADTALLMVAGLAVPLRDPAEFLP